VDVCKANARCVREAVATLPRLLPDAPEEKHKEVPKPPEWQVYAKPGGPGERGNVRILHHGVEVERIEQVDVSMDMHGRTFLTFKVELPPDGFIQVKGTANDYRTRK
jgi:hypothetical protein